MEERTKKTLEECKKLELKLSEAEKEKKNVEKKYVQVLTDSYQYQCICFKTIQTFPNFSLQTFSSQSATLLVFTVNVMLPWLHRTIHNDEF